MKKLLFFFTVFALGLIFTSCLNGKSHYTLNGYCYLTTDDRGEVYGRTSVGRLIKSNKLNSEILTGNYKYISFSWEEDQGTSPIFINEQVYHADNALITDDPIDIPNEYLHITEILPDPTSKFVAMECKFPDELGTYFNDRWIITYNYNIKNGEYAVVEFFSTGEVKEESNDKVIFIDARINIEKDESSTVTGNSPTLKTGYAALDMSSLRQSINFGSKETVYIKFRYYPENVANPVVSLAYPMSKIEQK